MLGETFRNAREARGATASEAADETHMKVQHVEALEREDFSRVAAPAYAKGFIRLYADYLGLDPEPLIQEYIDRFMPQERQVLMPEESESGEERQNHDEPAGFSLSDLKNIEWPFTFSKKQVAAVLGGAVMLIAVAALISMLWQNRKSAAEELAETVTSEVTAPRASPRPILLQGPPEPFIDLYEKRQDASQ